MKANNSFGTGCLVNAAAAYKAADNASRMGCEPVYQHKLLKMAADNGHAKAALEVAYLMLHGLFLQTSPDGPPHPVKDAAQARAYLKTAAMAGHPQGIFLYAKCLGRGIGGNKDPDTQDSLLKKIRQDYLQEEIAHLTVLEFAFLGMPEPPPRSTSKARSVA